MIHLYGLLPEMRKWRSEHWKTTLHPEHGLWKLEKDVRQTTPQEIKDILKEKSYTTIGEYLKENKLKI